MNRYKRQVALNEFSKEDQEKLARKTVAIVGIGGLGTTIVNMLTRIGVGKLIIMDDDKVNIKDLHRQIIYDERNVNSPKVDVIKQKLSKINNSVEVIVHQERLVSENNHLINRADIILDGSDNIETRYLINKIAYEKKIPWIYGSCTATRGMCFNIIPGETPCFECLTSGITISNKLEDPTETGTLGTAVSLIGLYQATQAIKILLGKEYNKKLFFMDLWKDIFEFLEVNKRKECRLCNGPSEDKNF
ncbi:MAG: ThiF family adenylyltransferase [Candidatus Aenigmatarchaeota archaeon]